MGTVRLTAFVKGRVQGVGFRWWTRARALELGLAGSATNLDDGRVQVVAEGPEEACRALVGLLPGGPGRVDFVAEHWGLRNAYLVCLPLIIGSLLASGALAPKRSGLTAASRA